MKINPTGFDPYTQLQGSTGTAQGGFRASLDEAKREAREAALNAERGLAADAAPAVTGAKTPQEELAEWLKKSPVEHMRDAILQAMGITEEELAQMPPEKRMAIEDTIARKIRERMSGEEEKRAASMANGQALLAMVAFASDAQKMALDKE